MKARQPVKFADEQSLRMIKGGHAVSDPKRNSSKPLFVSSLLVLALIAFIVGVGYLASVSTGCSTLSTQASEHEALICLPGETGLVCY